MNDEVFHPSIPTTPPILFPAKLGSARTTIDAISYMNSFFFKAYYNSLNKRRNRAPFSHQHHAANIAIAATKTAASTTYRITIAVIDTAASNTAADRGVLPRGCKDAVFSAFSYSARLKSRMRFN